MKTKLNKTKYNYIIQAFILILTLVFLYDELFQKQNLIPIKSLFVIIIGAKSFMLSVIVMVFLVPVNWFVESVKWRFLMKKLEKISLDTAFKGVLTGLSVSIFLPNRVGDYLGRVFILKKADRLQAILSTILGSMSQLLTTLLFGLAALAYVLPQWFDFANSFSLWTYIGIILSIILLMVIMLFAYLNFSVFTNILKSVSGKEYPRIKKYSSVFSWYHSKELLHVLLLSILRYLIFSFQFFLLLKIFEVPVTYPTAIILISIVYLMMTVVPTIAMTELAVRGSVSLYVFSYYFAPLGEWTTTLKQAVVASSSLLWLLNIALPALAGAFFVFKLRFFRNNNGNSH